MIAVLFAALAIATTAQPADAPIRLSIDGGTDITIRTRADVDRALKRCRPPTSCKVIMVEDCSQCWFSAAWTRTGYVVDVRHGPPGDTSVAMRAGDKRGLALPKGKFDPEMHASRFTLAQVRTMIANYMDDGRDTPGVVWKNIGSPLDNE